MQISTKESLGTKWTYLEFVQSLLSLVFESGKLFLDMIQVGQ